MYSITTPLQSTAATLVNNSQASLVAVLARGPEATSGAMAMLPAIAPELLVAPAECMFAARPGEVGVGVEEGALVVFVVEAGIPRGLVCQVIEMGDGHQYGGQKGTCWLRRLIDGKTLMDESGPNEKWVPVRSLAKAQGPLGATPLHLACLFGCAGGVVAALAERNPKACEAVDAFGRTPLSIAAQVPVLI